MRLSRILIFVRFGEACRHLYRSALPERYRNSAPHTNKRTSVNRCAWHHNDQCDGLVLIRTRPGSTTTNASRSRGPSFATASTTVAGLARRAWVGNLTRITPADERPRP